MSDSDKTFINTVSIVIAGLVVFMLVAIMIARGTTSKSPDEIANDPMYQAALLKRIKPYGEVTTTTANASEPAVAGTISGDKVYQSACFACHGTGVAGAPKVGDKAAWKPRIAQGMAVMLKHAVKGFKGMPAKGGHRDLSDKAVKAAIEHMVNKSQ